MKSVEVTLKHGDIEIKGFSDSTMIFLDNDYSKEIGLSETEWIVEARELKEGETVSSL